MAPIEKLLCRFPESSLKEMRGEKPNSTPNGNITPSDVTPGFHFCRLFKFNYILASRSAASGPKFVLWGHVEEILLLNKFFPIVDMFLSCEDIVRQSCAMVPRWRFLATFLRPVFTASRAQHVSDLHSKFA